MSDPASDPINAPPQAVADAPIPPPAFGDDLDAPREPLPDAAPAPGPYEARAGTYFRNVRYGLFALIFGYGLLSIYHGFFVWPADTAEFNRLGGLIRQADERQDKDEVARLTALQEQHPHHDAGGILFNQIFGVVLPPLAILLLARWLYISRGRVRLDADDTLHVPGHPPIPASSVTEIDDTRWDRKGITYVGFDRNPGGGATGGKVKLDDFVYEGRPIKHVHDRLLYLLQTRGGDVESPRPSIAPAD